VLVTGHSGFKGSWLCRWLGLLDADVRGFGLAAPTVPSLHGEARLADIVPEWRGDVRDPESLGRALRWAQPEVVFHLAARPIVLRSFEMPAETFDVNAMGTVRVLEATAKAPSVRGVVVVTSDKCYAPAATRAHVESDPLGGRDPYSASKAAAELVVASWPRTATAPALATARAGNVIGGGDWSDDRIVPDLARAAGEGRAAVLRHPGAVRPWQHVLEPLAGYLGLGAGLVAEGERFGRAWNFGPDPLTVRTVAELAAEFGSRWRSHGGHPLPEPELATSTGSGEEAELLIDSSAAGRELGWAPMLSFAEAVDLTACWYARRATDPAFDAAATMAEQIGSYELRAAGRVAVPA